MVGLEDPTSQGCMREVPLFFKQWDFSLGRRRTIPWFYSEAIIRKIKEIMLNQRVKLWYSAASPRQCFGKWKKIPMGPPSASVPKSLGRLLALAPVGCCHSDPCRDEGHGSGHKLSLRERAQDMSYPLAAHQSTRYSSNTFTNSTRTTWEERCCLCWALVWKIHLQRGWADTAVRSRTHSCFKNPSELGLL